MSILLGCSGFFFYFNPLLLVPLLALDLTDGFYSPEFFSCHLLHLRAPELALGVLPGYCFAFFFFFFFLLGDVPCTSSGGSPALGDILQITRLSSK